MADYKISGTDLTSVANAIRAKGGTSASLSFPDEFVSAIASIPRGQSTLISKTITANGVYSASDDSADGYSSVTVIVPTVVAGTFTADASEKGTGKTISIPYTGRGYPIAGFIYPSGGLKTGSDLAELAQKNVMIMVAFSKTDFSSTPDYAADEEKNYMEIVAYFKYSDSDPSSSSTGRGHLKRNYWDTNAGAAYADIIRFRSNTSLSVYIANTSYGFKDGIEYTYQIVYSE